MISKPVGNYLENSGHQGSVLSGIGNQPVTISNAVSAGQLKRLQQLMSYIQICRSSDGNLKAVALNEQKENSKNLELAGLWICIIIIIIMKLL